MRGIAARESDPGLALERLQARGETSSHDGDGSAGSVSARR